MHLCTIGSDCIKAAVSTALQSMDVCKTMGFLAASMVSLPRSLLLRPWT